MSSSFQPTNSAVETEKFEAFDHVTEALEYIDSYEPRLENKSVFEEAEKSLTAALDDKADPHYHKAKYLRAMVSYLKGDSADAIERFKPMSDSSGNPIFTNELAYNLGAAYHAAGRWGEAITKFEEVIANTDSNSEKCTEVNPELCLFARAGLVHIKAALIEEARTKLKALEKGEEAAAAEYEDHIRKYSEQIRADYELEQRAAEMIVDSDFVKEAERVIREAYKSVEGWTDAEVIELRPAESSKNVWEIFSGGRIIIAIGIVILLIIIASVVFPVRLDDLFSWFASKVRR